MGDENVPATSGESQPVAQNTHDLLADIFGSGGSDNAVPLETPAVSSRSAVDDIMGLFGKTGLQDTTQNAINAPASSTNLLSSMPVTSGSPVSANAGAAAPTPVVPKAQLQTYTAYEGKGLKVTLTPRTSAQQPGIVQILARFSATGPEAITNVNFQAAVPRVSSSSRLAITAADPDKTQQLQMQAMSNNSVISQQPETQQMRVQAPAGVCQRYQKIPLTCRLTFVCVCESLSLRVKAT